MKTTAKLTNAINNLEESIELLREESLANSDIEKMQTVIDSLRAIREPFLRDLEKSSDYLRERGMLNRGESRIKFFKNWPLQPLPKEILHSKIKSYVNWEFPCLEIFPGEGQTLPIMLGAEPLYIADWDKEVIDDVSKQFNDFYSIKRLMKYVIKGYDLTALPQNSFGFVCCLNWLRFENNVGLNKIAKSVFDCLMPGGSYFFTFNPSDKAFGVHLMEEGYAAGADSQQLATDLVSIGYEIEDTNMNATVCFMLVKKPGTITAIKHSSILGKVIDKSVEI